MKTSDVTLADDDLIHGARICVRHADGGERMHQAIHCPLCGAPITAHYELFAHVHYVSTLWAPRTSPATRRPRLTCRPRSAS
jgi:hypothetical protein